MATIAERFKSVASQLDDDDLNGLERYFNCLIECLEKGTVEGTPIPDPKAELLWALSAARWEVLSELWDREPEEDDDEEDEETDEEPTSEADIAPIV